MERFEEGLGNRREAPQPEVFRLAEAARQSPGGNGMGSVDGHAGGGEGAGKNTGKNPGKKPEKNPGEREGPHAVEPLRYLSLDGAEPAAEKPEDAGAGPEREWEERLAARDAEWQARCEAVRQEALAQGRAEMEGDRMELLRQCAGQWSQAVGSFANARDGYFARVEREVVDLALAIAARILQREAQVDPLLLAGAVRVALGQVAENTSVELRVPAGDMELWRETLRLMPNLPVMPTVVADSEMKNGECVLRTELGRVDLGARAQLKEIERGFFDLLSHRDPAAQRSQTRAGW